MTFDATQSGMCKKLQESRTPDSEALRGSAKSNQHIAFCQLNLTSITSERGKYQKDHMTSVKVSEREVYGNKQHIICTMSLLDLFDQLICNFNN